MHGLLALCWGLSEPLLLLELAIDSRLRSGLCTYLLGTPILSRQRQKPRQAAPVGARSELMCTLSQLHKPDTSRLKFPKLSEDHQCPHWQGAPHLCTSCTWPYPAGLCYSFEGLIVGVRAYGQILANPLPSIEVPCTERDVLAWSPIDSQPSQHVCCCLITFIVQASRSLLTFAGLRQDSFRYSSRAIMPLHTSNYGVRKIS
jgi:hypothetical protein